MKQAQRYKPKFVRHTAKCLKYDYENGKNGFDQGFFLVSSMLIVLGAPCLIISTSPYQCRAWLSSAVCLPPALSCAWSPSCPQTPWTLRCLWRSLSGQDILYSVSQLKAQIMCLCCPHNCLISSEYNRVTNCLEWHFTTFIDLDFKLFGVFLKSA